MADDLLAQIRLNGAVPRHVADQRGHGAVRQLQRVVEVRAEQRPPLAGLDRKSVV